MNRLNLQLLSRRRGFLMGMAILLVMFCHNTVPFGPAILPGWIALERVAQCGVDMFFFLSGFSLYYSYSGNPRPAVFWKKRLLRILPAYLLVAVPYAAFLCLFGFSTVKAALWNYSLISFFLAGNLTEWFIAAVLALYLLFPLFFRLVEKCRHIPALCLAIWVLAVAADYLALPPVLRTLNQILFARLPVFLLGIRCGQLSLQQREDIPDGYRLRSAAIAAVLFWVLAHINFVSGWEHFWVVMRILFCPLAISLCLVGCKWAPRCSGRFARGMEFLGGITLELYLVHEKLLAILDFALPRLIRAPFLSGLAANLLAVPLSIAAARVLSRLCARLVPKRPPAATKG